MTSQEFYEKLVTQQTQDLFLDEEHLLQRVTVAAQSQAKVYRKMPLRKTFVLAVALAVLISLGCITAVAVTVLNLPGLAAQMGMNPDDLNPSSASYGIFDRYFTLRLENWNEERKAAGLEPMNAGLIVQMVSAGDMTVEEVYKLYGRVPLPEEEYQKVKEKYGELDQLEASLSVEQEMMDRLFWAQKNGERALTDEELEQIEAYQAKRDRISALRQQMSRELQALESGYNSPDQWPKEVPAQWKIPDALEGEVVIRENLALIGGQLDGFGKDFSTVQPTYDLVADAARLEGLSMDDSTFTIPADIVEKRVREFFGPDVKVVHGSSGEGTDLALSYDPEAGTYTGRWGGRSEGRFPCLLSWERQGSEIVLRVVFVYITEQPQEGDIYYYLDEDRGILASFSSSFDGLSEYQVQQMADTLPQWEYRLQVMKVPCLDEQGRDTGDTQEQVIIHSIKKIR
ncbi:hypothetical protein [Zongyangia hominis]|uniref:Uncharacterized protein n=1 Tax=Zongyangia hominis TaxID=2763677 RepID=A0A926EB02_9FIRM|nr:hypothetical protein [Zongyangia hominis]MBC8570478.1 hypothetical protein [Zongyangia hominis]